MGSYDVAEIPKDIQAFLLSKGIEVQIFTCTDNEWKIHYIKKVNGFWEKKDTVKGQTKEDCLHNLLQTVSGQE